jgi:hypothetical protein
MYDLLFGRSTLDVGGEDKSRKGTSRYCETVQQNIPKKSLLIGAFIHLLLVYYCSSHRNAAHTVIGE